MSDENHPGMCKTCIGKGIIIYWDDPSGLPGYIGMEFEDPCPTCIGNGNCPQCGREMDYDGVYCTCLECGWTDKEMQ